MWKCKTCSNIYFTEEIIGGNQKTTFDSDGNCIKYEEQNIEYGDVSCDECGNTGYNIEEIAYWVEEKEEI